MGSSPIRNLFTVYYNLPEYTPVILFMDTINSWSIKALEIAKNISKFSHDKHLQVGAVAFKGDLCVAMGTNRFPEKVQVTLDRLEKPFKYKYMLHAEESLILNAGQEGVSLKEASCVLTYFPCLRCTRLLIQTGISALYIRINEADFKRHKEKYEFTDSLELLLESGIHLFGLKEDGTLWDGMQLSKILKEN